MSDAETWGIVLRDRASGAEQWVACDVTRDGDVVTARAHGYGYRSVEYAQPAVEGVGRLILQHDRTLSSVRIAAPAEYAAHMEGVRRALVADEVERLRAEVTRLADTIGATVLRVCAESCERDVILDAIRERGEDAFRRGAEAMREMAAGACERIESDRWEEWIASDYSEKRGASRGARDCAAAVCGLPLPTEATPQPAQSHEAPETPAAPDADAWVESWADAGPRGLRVIRFALATAAPERWQAERLVDAAWLSRGRIDMGGDPLSMWHAIIDEAVLNERLGDLVAAARAKYPSCGL